MAPVRIGYRSVFRPEDARVLKRVPEVAPLVRRPFDLATTGIYSLLALVRAADEMSLKSRLGKRLGGSAIHQILRDALYKG